MLVTPDSTIELYGDVPITAGREVMFSSPANQRSYFVSKRIAQDVDCTYIRKTGRLKIEHPTSQVSQCTFIGFKNAAFENKWIYARILDYNYINNVTTEITYAIDWFQTHMFDCRFFESQIEREHLSETDWTNAVANPFRKDILELNTPEDIAVGSEDYETVSDLLPHGGSHFLPLPDPMSGGGYNSYVVVFGVTDFGTVDPDTPLGRLVSFLNTFVTDPVNPVTVESLINVSGGRSQITPTNVEIGLFPNTVRIFLMREKTDLATMIDLMTLAGVTNNIIGIYYIPPSVLCLLDDNYEDPNTGGIGQPTSIQWADKVISPSINPKLSRAPYSYIEVVSPDGNVKELHYENFVDLVDGESSFKLTTIFTLHGTPLLSLIPYNYRVASHYDSSPGGYPRINNNIKERIDFGSFPQVGYSIDAYLTFLSGVYNEAVTNRTLTKRVSRGMNLGTSIAGLAGTVAGLANGGTGAAVSAGNIMNGASSFAGSTTNSFEILANENMLAELAKRNEKNIIYTDSLKDGSHPYDLYGETSDAYCNDEYHAGCGGNYSAYDIGFIGFNVFFKRINASKRTLITKYLNTFGYKSGRIGVPRVCNYISGSGDSPHFTTIDNKQCTYVKTAGMQVEAPHEVASNYIQSMFDLGCRFEKGD